MDMRRGLKIIVLYFSGSATFADATAEESSSLCECHINNVTSLAVAEGPNIGTIPVPPLHSTEDPWFTRQYTDTSLSDSLVLHHRYCSFPYSRVWSCVDDDGLCQFP